MTHESKITTFTSPLFYNRLTLPSKTYTSTDNRRRRGEKGMGGGVPLPSRLGAQRSVLSSPVGLGGASAENQF